MIVLHAGETEGSISLWAESVGGRTMGSAKRARKSARHPSSVKGSEIRRRLGIPMWDGSHQSIEEVWLPSAGNRPLSYGQIAPPPGSGQEACLMPWRVQILRLSAKDAIRVLSDVARSRNAVAGMAVGPDLAYWSDALRLAASAVARQRFLPDLVDGDYEHRAVWRPVFLGRDRDLLLSLARRMPPAGRAFDNIYDGTPPMDSPAAVLRRVIGGFVDHMVRSAASAAAPRGYANRRRFDSAHDGWLHGLRTQHSYVDFDRDRIAAGVGRWQRPITPAINRSLKFCLRLEEPAGAARARGRTWFVRYLVQSRTDPSVIIPAEEVWRRKTVPELGGAGGRAREFLLTSMERISGLVAGMSDGLEKCRMAGHAVDTEGAHRFLSEEAPVLEQLGYGVMLPSWWVGGTRTRITARARVRQGMRAGGMLGINSVIRFDWRLALGDKRITLGELERLARAKSSLIRMRGRWVETGSEEIRRAIDFLKRNARMTVRDAVVTGFGSDPAPAWLDLKIDGGSRISELIRGPGGSAEIRNLPQPDGFAGTLRPYQLRGYSWLAFLQGIGLGGCLADDMGLGKTVQVLALAQRYRREGRKGPILLVCPTSVMDNWRKEAARFAPDLSVAIHHGADRKRDAAFARNAAGHDLVVSSYGLVHRDIGFVRRVRWGGVVLDEAQNIKNPETKQARAARSLDAGFRFALTGTPVENSVGDLWSIMEFLNPGLLGTRAEFRRNFFLPIQGDGDAQAAETLRRITGPFMLRRLKTDRSVIADLPEKMEMNVYCPLTREQASLYAAVLKDLEDRLDTVDGIRRKGLILATLTRLKQVCNHPAHLLKDGSAIADRSGKLARLAEMLDEVISSGERALVFTQFVEMGEILQRHLAGTLGDEVPFLHGGVPKKRRDAMVERFQEGGSGVFIVSLKAGGTGLNLTAASHVFHFDRWWNPAVENQATDRVFRIGQRRDVQVHKMICTGTVEERIDEIINRKKGVSDRVVGTGEGWLTKLSNREIREVLSLSRRETRI